MARRTEGAISAEIIETEARLETLYEERRGRMVDGTGDGDTAPAWGWCANCGRVKVYASDGDDTCRACLENI